ncbi:MAG: DUF4280 domain-containing protein [Alphaproteobacteria bacterium]|nr:DUF4280 domain-containing protein [Alphaproteobacteria bacterium]MCB9792283.1 DUF4280 domain-containing protein [Alphaproteobacteria bacterium]
MAGELVVDGATLRCSVGTTPGRFLASPGAPSVDGLLVGRVDDTAPGANIPLFGTCLATPSSPKPCAPALAGPWTPGCARLSVGGVMALDSACMASCSLGGLITVEQAGQARARGG